MLKKSILAGLVAAVVLALVAAPSLADGPKGTAVIKGKAVFDGSPPKPKALPITGDNHCVQAHTKPEADQGTIVYSKDGNTIPFVFVYVKNGIKDKYDPPAEPVLLDQKDCMYVPHVFGMIAGQQLNIRNSDPTNHNIHSLAKKNPAFNFAQPNAGMVKELKGKETFNKEEIMVKVKCDVHAWMSTYCGVLTHPFFAVTISHEHDGGDNAKRGSFEIKELPAGDYEVAAWHETFGEVTQKVSVKDGETKEIEFKFGAKADATPPKAREVILSANTDADEKK